MQNTIVKEFEGHPEVVTAIYNQGGSHEETRDWLEIFWENYYLRGRVLWDETGLTAMHYQQPQTGLPFGRGFIIDQTGHVALPYFGHQPDMAIAKIYELLGECPDRDGDGYTDEVCGGTDCDDSDPDVNPGMEGLDCSVPPDGIDGDCDGEVDEDLCPSCFVSASASTGDR